MKWNIGPVEKMLSGIQAIGFPFGDVSPAVTARRENRAGC